MGQRLAPMKIVESRRLWSELEIKRLVLVEAETEIRRFPDNTVWAGRKPPYQKPAPFVQSFRYNTGL